MNNNHTINSAEKLMRRGQIAPSDTLLLPELIKGNRHQKRKAFAILRKLDKQEKKRAKREKLSNPVIAETDV